jgi:hypothetical protein
MPVQDRIDAQNNARIDETGPHLVSLLRAAQAEELFGAVVVAFHFKAGVLTKRVIQKESTELMLLPSQQ